MAITKKAPSFGTLPELPQDPPLPMRGLVSRQEARDGFADRGLPTTRQEEWKYTRLSALAVLELGLPESSLPHMSLPTIPQRQNDGWPTLVFLNGVYREDLSQLDDLAGGVSAGNLAGSAPEGLGGIAAWDETALSSLNAAYGVDGARIQVAPGFRSSKPVRVVWLGAQGAQPTLVSPRLYVSLGINSELTLVEEFIGEGGIYHTNAVAEVSLGSGASLEHVRVENESLEAFHTTRIDVHQARDSRYANYYVSAGGRLVRSDVRVTLAEPGAEALLNGLYIGSGERHVDTHTTVDHAAAHCASTELYKGVLGQRARGVFNGRVLVREDSQKTDARQHNLNLLLSPDARVHTKPELEIYADDVKCAHGATVGQLDQQARFYLRSRGLGLDQATQLLTYGFASDVLDSIPVEGLGKSLAMELFPEFFGMDETPDFLI